MRTRYFGPADSCPPDHTQAPTPIGRFCAHCESQITAGAQGIVAADGRIFHAECTKRAPRYFGPAGGCKPHELHVVTPHGARCIYCAERIALGDMGTINTSGQIMHYECGLRAIVGSVGHQLGRCSCFGGHEEDPAGLSVREAAKEAARLWHERQSMPHFRIVRDTRMRSIECLDCGAKSYNSKDLENRYCGRCHKFHQRHDLYVGRLLVAIAGAQGLDADELERDTGPNARGVICAIVREAGDQPYALLFPGHGGVTTWASAADLRDPTKYQLLED